MFVVLQSNDPMTMSDRDRENHSTIATQIICVWSQNCHSHLILLLLFSVLFSIFSFFYFVVSCSIVCCFCNSLFLNRVRYSLYLMILLLLLFFPCRRCRSSSSFVFLKWWIGLTVCVREFSSMCKSVWSPLICAFHRVNYTQSGKPIKLNCF